MRARVVVSFAVLLAGAELVSVVVLRQVGEARMVEQATRDLTVAVEDLRVRLGHVQGDLGREGGTTISAVFDDFLRARPARGDQAFVTFVDGRPFAASASAPIRLTALPEAARWAGLRTTEAGEVETLVGPVRWIAVPVLAGDELLGVFVATVFLSGQMLALRDTTLTVGLITFLVLAVACLLAWGAAGRALSPVHDLADTAASVGGGDDLSARIAVDSTDEVGRLAASFNGMLDRLQVAFDSQKRFLDEAGHQLRTPITVVRGHLELLDDDDAVAREQDVALMLDELDRMERLVAELRLLARSERPDFLTPGPFPIEELIDDIGRKVETMAPRRWSVASTAGGTVWADRQRLTEAVLNLVDNAVHATTEDDEIEVGARTGHGTLEISVRDSGPGIAAEDQPTLFDRTDRSVRHRPGGTGLGLPIVAAIARAHGGSAQVESELGAGTTFTIRIPAQPAATR